MIFISYYSQLSEHTAEQARLARLPYHAGDGNKLPLKKVAQVALIFCLLVSLKHNSISILKETGTP